MVDTVFYVLAFISLLALAWVFWEDKSTDINFKHKMEALDTVFKYNMSLIYSNRADETVEYKAVLLERPEWFYRSKSQYDYLHPDFIKLLEGKQDA